MKVLFVHSGNFSYGIESFIKSQGESLKEKGVKLSYFPVKGKGVKGYFKNIRVIKKEAKNYDIIHAHYGLIGLLCVLSFTKKPLVLSIMGSDAYGSYNLEGKRIFKSYFIMFLTQLAIIKPKALIAKSKNILKYIPYKNKTQIIANGVNFSMFRPLDKEKCRKELNIKFNKKVLLFLGNPEDPRKNYDLVQKAVKKITDNDFLLINPFPIKHKDFVTYLNASDAFILASYNEGSPNVVKEAMACNIPVLTTDVGDAKEIIHKTKGCYLIDFDTTDVAEKIKLIMSFGKRTTGRNDINHLDGEIVAQKIIDIYNKVL